MPSENAPAPEKPVVMAQVGLQFTQTPVFILGAVALFHRLALFDEQNFVGGAALAQQLQRGENAGRAGAYDDKVIHG